MESYMRTTSPSVVVYDGRTYRSSVTYSAADGGTWSYVGICDGTSLWARDSEPDLAWPLAAVIDEVGPLSEAGTR
ncbi:hypothetical protein D7294_16865 [Streptomyces hoynatensis]|uniref:Uncharacterized protein n=2 Tax=Streptomyces hoynatensis TaxID=1141874 RepID=A0A3A9YXL0_9ACTN|nr:hypothetical protein D7294_16865 [Streptomyces hoynatensis]